jgi:type IV secretory pathway VirB10-like protein
MSLLKSSTRDPRTSLSSEALSDANARAMPAFPESRGLSLGTGLGIAGVTLLGALTFMSLASQRAKLTVTPLPGAATAAAPAPPPVALAPAPAAPAPPPPAPSVQPTPPPPVAPAIATAPTGPSEAERLRAPAMIVDLTKATPVDATADAKPGDKPGDMSADEKFADRVAQAENQPARAIRIANSSDIVPQGAVLTAVLETAINSDLPGYARAVVSREVTGFDGRKVLIPRGSRLIGQYRSASTSGQTRAFVVWTRLMRPDGVSVQLGSPVTDTLGRAGVSGKVDTHFFKRFGSAILLSVLESGLDLLSDNQSSVIVSSAQDAKSVASIALQSDIAIPPTIKIAQGTPIRIFLARDLDFSGTSGKPVE